VSLRRLTSDEERKIYKEPFFAEAIAHNSDVLIYLSQLLIAKECLEHTHLLKEISWFMINLCCFTPPADLSVPEQLTKLFDKSGELLYNLVVGIQSCNDKVYELSLEANKATNSKQVHLSRIMKEYETVIDNLVWAISNLCTGNEEIAKHVISVLKVPQILATTLRVLPEISIQLMQKVELILDVI